MTIADLERETRKEFPEFRIVPKAGNRFMRTLDVLLKIITFGQMKWFMPNFTTTIGYTIYTPERWGSMSELSRMIIIRHERIHMRQSKRYGRVLFSLMYLLWPIPIRRAYGRRKLEKEAYEVSLRCILQAYGPKRLLSPAIKENMVKHFTTAQYFWMWIRKSDIEEWYDSTVLRLLDEEGYDENGD